MQKKAGLDKDTGKLMFFSFDTTQIYPNIEISNVLVSEEQEINYLQQQIAGKKFKIENDKIVEIIKTQAEIDSENLAWAKQILSSKVTQTRKAIQGEPIKYGAKQFPTSDKALTNMTGEIALALYAFCEQEFGAKFTNFMKSIPATWTTVDGENVNTNIDDLYAIGNAIRNKTRPLYTNEANVLNKIHNATKVEDVEAIAGTYKPTLPTTTDGSDGLFNTDGAMAGGL